MNNEYEYNLIEQMLTLINVRDGGICAQDDKSESANEQWARAVKKFIDEIPGGFFIYEAHGDERILFANKALLRIFGCKTRAEFQRLTGNSFKGMVYSEDLDAVENSISEQIARSNEDLDYVEYRIKRKDGEIRWVEDYGHFVHSDTIGDIFYVFISDATEIITRRTAEKQRLIREKHEKERKLQDMTEEYDKERKLIRQEHLQRLEVIEGLSVNYDSILYADLDKNSVLPYRLSSRLERQFEKKLSPKPLLWFLDNYVNVWVHPEDRKHVAKLTSVDYMREKLKENRTYYVNYRCVQNGEVQFLQLRLVNVGSGENVSQVVMGYRNVDVEILQEMQQKQLLQEALHSARLAHVAKSSFLSNMSHDMRTPLNAIFGYTSLAKKCAQNPEIADYLDKIETAGNQILDLIDRVLEISYMDSQDYHIDESPCNICAIARKVTDSISDKAAKKHICVTLNTQSVVHGDVIADKDKLQNILSHLADNAVKYTGHGGKIEITVCESQKAAKEFSAYSVTVKDSGIGISKKYLERIFEPFERENNSTISGEFGSGLGLTIAKHLAEKMGGAISVKSQPGKGSSFTLTLGLRKQNVSDFDAKNGATAAVLSGKKILLVEDNEINLEIETEILRDSGLIVDTAENGKIALDKLKASRDGEYSFILMDLQMPVMDGFKAAKAIRKLDNKALCDIPIVALSANALESDKRLSMEAGMNAHISKPLDIK